MSKATPIQVPCGCCKGKGSVELTGVYADTLALLKRQMRRLTGAEVGKRMGCSNEAACNRLVALERYGLAKSERYGRKRLWEATA